MVWVFRTMTRTFLLLLPSQLHLALRQLQAKTARERGPSVSDHCPGNEAPENGCRGGGRHHPHAQSQEARRGQSWIAASVTATAPNERERGEQGKRPGANRRFEELLLLLTTVVGSILVAPQQLPQNPHQRWHHVLSQQVIRISAILLLFISRVAARRVEQMHIEKGAGS